MCIYAVSALKHTVFAAGELLCAGIDANEMKFRRTGCFDVGVECGGWGRIVMEVRTEDRNKWPVLDAWSHTPRRSRLFLSEE